MHGSETCNKASIRIEHVRKGCRILIQVILQKLVPLNGIHILIISHCHTVRVSATPPTVFDGEI